MLDSRSNPVGEEPEASLNEGANPKRPGRASNSVRVFGKRMPLPRNRWLRISIGVLLVFGGLLGFLPILGFWMIPLGLLVLSIDLGFVRRYRRRADVWWTRKRRARAAKRQNDQQSSEGGKP